MVNNNNKVIKDEDEQFEKFKGQMFGKIRFLFTYYNKEFWYGIVVGLSTSLSMFNCFEQFPQILLLKNDNDESELKTVKM